MTMNRQWPWLVDPPCPGAVSMQIDEELLHRVENASPKCTIVRFYRWAEPTISVGKHQRIEESIRLEYCKHHGIPVVRRPTGGRSVFHADELTYSLVSNDWEHFPLHSVQKTYLRIATALQKGLRQLQIPVELAEGGREVGAGWADQIRKPCFASSTRYELLSRGRKIAGSAQKRLKRSFLQHGSIPLRIDYEVMAAALGVEEEFLQAGVISVSRAAGRDISFGSLSQALQTGFEEAFQVRLYLP